MSNVYKLNVGDRVVLARPDEYLTSIGLAAGMVGTVSRTYGDGLPQVAFDSGVTRYVIEHQLDLIERATPPRRDDRRERIATAVLAGFAADSFDAQVHSLAREAVEWADALIEELDR